MLSTACPVFAEIRIYGPLILDFDRAQKMGQSIVVPSKNSKGQPLFIAVLCTERLFNLLVLNQNGMIGVSQRIFTRLELLRMHVTLFDKSEATCSSTILVIGS